MISIDVGGSAIGGLLNVVGPGGGLVFCSPSRSFRRCHHLESRQLGAHPRESSVLFKRGSGGGDQEAAYADGVRHAGDVGKRGQTRVCRMA